MIDDIVDSLRSVRCKAKGHKEAIAIQTAEA